MPQLTDTDKWHIINNTYQARQEKRQVLAVYEKHKAEKLWSNWINSPNGMPAKLGKFMSAVKNEPIRHILL